MQDYEKLGVFYIGRETRGDEPGELVLLDSRDFTTHAVCVGMTGSGKTGLCVTLLEEAAIDGIPVIAIDPKGDLANLALTFPDLRPDDFRPWIDPAAPARAGMSPDEFAAKEADKWRKGLADWGQPPERIQRLRDSAPVTIFTPGSPAGAQVRALGTLAAPPPSVMRDEETLRDRVLALVSSLLTLIGADADPLQSRDHILLSTIVERAWREGRNLDLASLIAAVQTPGFEQVGVFDLESFYPGKERFKLAMTLNNLLASPGFAGWMEGEPLDPQRLLYTPEGKPRVSVFSIAHLSDAERMFFVTLLLNEIVTWMRAQSGAGSLRALIYMDEIMGFFPPTANPPSKRPMLTLLKQARAYGVGVVLATQNPVDLDYKGLSNAGIWFIGRLQTERDKMRVLDGLEGAAGGGLNRAEVDRLISGLESRRFLMSNAHEDGLTLFQTRWAMSYLCGPLTRAQIQALQPAKAAPPAPQPATSPTPPPSQVQPAEVVQVASGPPPLPPEAPQWFVRGAGESARYEPVLLGVARAHYARSSLNLHESVELIFTSPLDDESALDPWSFARTPAELPNLESTPAAGRYGELPAEAHKEAAHVRWRKGLVGHVYRSCVGVVWKAPALREFSSLNETEGDFRARLRHRLHELRDAEMEKLRQKYAPKIERLQRRLETAEERVEREQAQVSQQGYQTAVSFGSTLLGALFGRKKFSAGNVGRAATTARGAGRIARERGDVARAKENEAAIREDLASLEAELRERVDELRDQIIVDEIALEEVRIPPRKSDIEVLRYGVIWLPRGAR
ncbi:MAG: DUF87 domain-containing protein [Phycisphaerales bacterium]|nr:DUF87 domain-containing protein [Phycisphaerales bacterium]